MKVQQLANPPAADLPLRRLWPESLNQNRSMMAQA
jgi:hypothetical protein